MISETLAGAKIDAISHAARSLKKQQQARNGNHRSHIVSILPRGEAIRNFVYTGVLDEVAREARVTLLSVVPNSELETTLRAHCHDLISLSEIGERALVENLREVLDMAHGRWLWSKAAQERWLIHDAQANGSRPNWKRIVKKIICRPFASRVGLQMLSRLERASSRALKTTDEYVNLFSRIKPSLVFNGSHVHSRVAIQAVQAAQWLGIPTAAFIFSWDNLTSQGRIIPHYDYYLVWNKQLQNQLLEIYNFVKPEQVIVTGTPQFDFHFRPEFRWSRKKFCAEVGADALRPIVLYSTGMANHMPGEPLIVERLAAMLREMTDLGSPQLLVRVYPKDMTNRFDEVKQKCPDILFPKIPWERVWLTPRMEDAYMLTNMLRHAAVGINIASTVSLELCMFNKPVLNVGYNPPGVDISPVDYCRYYDFDHYQPLVKSGAVKVAQSEEEMRELLRRALTEPQTESAKRHKLINQMFGDTLDGYSSVRVASQLIKLANERRPLHV